VFLIGANITFNQINEVKTISYHPVLSSVTRKLRLVTVYHSNCNAILANQKHAKLLT